RTVRADAAGVTRSFGAGPARKLFLDLQNWMKPGLVRLVWMERLVRVEFGPSRSKRFDRALAEARSGVGECSELEPGRYRASFVLGEDPAAYTGLARMLERVRHWRATDVYEDDELVSVLHAKEMAWCASFQLKSFRAWRFRCDYGVWPRW